MTAQSVVRGDEDRVTASTSHTVSTTLSRTRIPHLRKTKNSAQLIVKDKPFLMLAGELHNSSLSSAEFMSTVYPNMKAMNLNTLLGAVTWEMIEPVEGQFNFSDLDKVILEARKWDMHLVLLWFGSYKNAMSTYVPAWVKKDVKRFPRVHVMDEDKKLKTIELISPFCERCWQADAQAFKTLMRHLKEFDSDENTVLMVQVENETGLLGDSMDRSKTARQLFEKPVPKQLLDHLQAKSETHPKFEQHFPNIQAAKPGQSTWTEAFGAGISSEEVFMAYAISQYVNHVAEAGKAEYSIPFYTNVWLNYDDPAILDLDGIMSQEAGAQAVAGGGAKAGIYPSGGPCPHVLDIWKQNTPSLDFIAPDLYLHDYEWVCQAYRHEDQPLFIPEQKRDAKGARRVWLAYGTYGALGCGPFGIDSLEAKNSPFTQTYSLLNSVSKEILSAQADRPDNMMGFFFDELHENSPGQRAQWRKTFGNFEVIIDRAFVFGKAGPGFGIVIHQGDGKFLLIGKGFQVTFKSAKPTATFTGILSAEEKVVDENGDLRTLRVMNGDETRSGAFMIMPNDEPDYGGFPIAVTIPARTCIAEVTAYSLEETDEDF